MKKTPNLLKPLKTAFRAADLALFSLLLCLPLRPRLKSAPLFLAVYAGALAAVFLLHGAANKRRARETKRKEGERYAIERLLLTDDDTLRTLTGEPGFVLVRSLHPDIADVACALRSGATSLGLFEITAEARAFLDRHAPQCRAFDREQLLHLVSNGGEQPQHVRKCLPDSPLFSKYLCLGILLLALSFLVRLKIYFRSVASICLILSAFSGVFRNSVFQKKIHRIS